MNKVIKKIAVVEPLNLGHKTNYLISIVNAFLEKGYEVECYTSKNNQSFFSGKCNVTKLKYREYYTTSQNKFVRAYTYLKCCIAYIYNITHLHMKLKNRDIDFVYFCCIEEFMHALFPISILDFAVKCKFSGLLIQESTGNKFWKLNSIKVLKSKYCNKISVLPNNVKSDKTIFFPDFTLEVMPNTNNLTYNEIIKKSGNRIKILMIGAISMQKGLHLFSDLCKSLPSDKFFFIIAGSSRIDNLNSKLLLQELEKRENCLISLNNMYSEADYDSMFLATDIVYAVFENFPHSSNTLTKIAKYKKPIIVSNQYYIGEMVRKYNLGKAIKENDLFECISAVNEIVIEENKRDYEAFYELNNEKKISSSLYLILEQ